MPSDLDVLSEPGAILRLRMQDQYADLSSHHIEGHANAAIEQGNDGYFSTPLLSEIEDGLWMGGCIDGLLLPEDFRYVLSLYPWGRYRLPEGCERDEVRMFDSADSPDADLVDELALRVNRKRFTEGKKTLVHCQAGLNRSSLIVARALTFCGRSAKGAVEEVRAKRSPMALCNRAFEEFLLGG